VKRYIHLLIGMALAAICIGGARAAALPTTAGAVQLLHSSQCIETGSPEAAKTRQ
jgi:hypothetical protein